MAERLTPGEDIEINREVDFYGCSSLEEVKSRIESMTNNLQHLTGGAQEYSREELESVMKNVIELAKQFQNEKDSSFWDQQLSQAGVTRAGNLRGILTNILIQPTVVFPAEPQSMGSYHNPRSNVRRLDRP